jgi:predicted kinase
MLTACLQAGQRFVVDNTNGLASDRARYLLSARRAYFRAIAYFFRTSLPDAIRRNNQRDPKEKVPVVAVVNTFKKLQPPLLEEGFEKIYTIELNAQDKFVIARTG